MKTINLCCFLTFTLLLCFFNNNALAQDSLTKGNLVKDLDTYRDWMTVYDIDPFEKITKGEFINEIEQIKKDTGTKNIDELLIELMRVNSNLMDEHSEIGGFKGKKFLPFVFTWFDEGIYITKTEADHNELLYSKLVAINHIPIDKITQEISEIISDKNPQYIRDHIDQFITRDKILHGLDIVDNTESASLTLLTAGNETVNITCLFKKKQDIAFNSYGRSKAFLRYHNADKNYWYEYESDKNYLYLKYNSCFEDPSHPFSQFADDFMKEAELRNPAKIIIDMRDNGGGTRAQIKPLLYKLYQSKFNRSGCFYVLIGGGTFSAGMNNVFDIGRIVPINTIGQSTGASINHLGQPEEFHFPNCGLHVGYSTNHIVNKPGVIGPTGPIKPDIEVPEKLSDFKNFRDATLNYAIEH